MAREFTCESCGRKLSVADHDEETWLTCPACLAHVPVPLPRRSASDISAGPAPPSCPRCGKPVQPAWVSCPNCAHGLHEIPGGRRGVPLDRHVRRDQRGTSIGLVLLAVLGGLGIFPFFGAMESAVYYDATPLIVGCIVILFLTLLSTVIMFWRTRHNPSARSFGRVVLGTFALAGVCVLLCFALVLFMFVVCLANPHAFF